MRVVFMGTPEFAIPSLDALQGAHDVVGVYCRPDRRVGRGRRLTAPPIKLRAEALGLSVSQPERFDAEATAALRSLAPDIVCVAAYGTILPAAVLGVPRYGALNVHASLLPRHRGAAPVERSILEGDAETGVSIMQMEESLDTGPVALQVRVPIGEHTAHTLAEALSRVGADALLEVVEGLESDAVEWVAQEESDATYAAKVSATDVEIEPAMPMIVALRRVRASSRRAPVRVIVCGRPAIIVAGIPSEASVPVGEVSTTDGLHIGLSDGALQVTMVRPENRAEMSGGAFVNGLSASAERTWVSAL